MYCPSCGSERSAGAPFCSQCGVAWVGEKKGITVANVYRGKKLQLYGLAAFFGGIALAGLGAYAAAARGASYGPALIGVGIWTTAAGFIATAVGKFQHWYHAE